MAVYTQLANEDIAQLTEDTYGLGKLALAVGIAQGVENSNYLIELTDRTKYILTLYEKRVAAADVPFFLQLMQYLATHGIACPQPVARRDGSLWGDVAGRPAAMVSFLEGKSRTRPDVVHCSGVGSMAASLHAAVAGFPGARANSLSLEGWCNLFLKIEGWVDEIHPGLKDLIAGELDYLKQHWSQVQSLPRGIVHADLFPDNVFFVDDAVSGVIDFYFACEDAFAYDLAITVNAWCFERSHEFNRTKAASLLAAYQKQRPLSDVEKHALPLLMRGAALRFLLTRAHDLIFHEKSALVTPKDPLEYAAKLRFHQRVTSAAEYGL